MNSFVQLSLREDQDTCPFLFDLESLISAANTINRWATDCKVPIYQARLLREEVPLNISQQSRLGDYYKKYARNVADFHR